MSACFAAAALTLLASASAIQAATALNGNLTLRPLTAEDVSTYKLPAGTELSGGLNTVGVGTAVYLEAEVNIAIPASDITDVTWSLTAKPAGSSSHADRRPLGSEHAHL